MLLTWVRDRRCSLFLLFRALTCVCAPRVTGLIANIGVSNCDAAQVRRAVAAAHRRGRRIVVNQILFNLLDYNSSALREVERTCKELGVTIMGYGPLVRACASRASVSAGAGLTVHMRAQGQGLLTDKLTPERMPKIRMTRMTGVTWETLQNVRGVLHKLAKAHGKTMAQVAVNWTVSKGHIALVGCKTLDHVTEAVGGVKGWRLTTEEVAALDEAALSRSTLEKPKWRRGFFMSLLSFLVFVYYVERWFWFPSTRYLGVQDGAAADDASLDPHGAAIRAKQTKNVKRRRYGQWQRSRRRACSMA